MFAVYKKELRSYFTTVIGWVFIAFFLVLAGLYFMIYNLLNGMTDFSYVYQGVQMFFVLLLVPVLTMRIVAEENRQKTDQLLYTAPVSISRIIVGKYLALITLLAIAVLIVSTYPLILSGLVNGVATGGETVDFAIAYGATFGFLLLGAAYIAIGLFISSLTESQVIAAVASGVIMIFTYLMSSLAELLPSDHVFIFWFLVVFIIVVCFVLNFWIHNVWVSVLAGIVAEVVLVVLYLLFTESFDGLLENFLSSISITDRYTSFTLGIFDISALVYYISVCFLFVFITVQRIKKKRYN
ncbi:MAG: ABC transporter permease subunit [Lachnospiraceae bacterium]|nr:ABC transporter permease subunit [Lachnospiraceae bacterium]